jgi:zinc/manganese transport system substrate-binding protein
LKSSRLVFTGAVVVGVGLTLSGCGSSSGGGSASSAAGAGSAASSGSATSAAKTLNVVASTNVYGDIVKDIAGDKAHITSIISDPDADPHSYEASTQNQLELSKADLVIQNGGGYDDFISKMLKSAGNKDAKVLNVVNISGKKAPKGGELNEHVWYDFPTMTTLVNQVVSVLSAKDPADASSFATNGAGLKKKLTGFEKQEAAIKKAHAGDGVAITEPVPLYLLQACGLVNKTPGDFSEAIEEGDDVSPSVLNQTLKLFSSKQVKLLAYNEQTSGPETEKVLSAAKSNHIAVVPVTETLPKGKSYLTWMSGNLAAVKAALG